MKGDIMPKSNHQAPNGAVHGLMAFLTHSSNWGLIIGVVLGIVALCVPHWTGMPELTAICDKLAVLLPGIFGAVSVGQKFADGLSKGKTSAFNRHLELKDQESIAAISKDEDE
jgi:hypothetical protein